MTLATKKPRRSSRPGTAEPAANQDTFMEASSAARSAPESEEAWEKLEELAAASQRPDEVASLYREVLKSDISAELASNFGRRATRFHEEWFGEDSPYLAEVLTRVWELDPSGSQWAFQRLSVVYTVGERWAELLDLYDKALAVEKSDSRRVTLLEEVAQCAKDFAGKPERAIDYYRQLLSFRPGDVQVVASLERLLERQQRWHDLIDLWKQRLDGLPPAEAHSTRLRIASLYLEMLHDHASALHEVASWLGMSQGGVEDAYPFLEKMVTDTQAPLDVRRTAFEILKQRYESSDRVADLVRMLDAALDFVEGRDQFPLHKQAAERLVASGDHPGAMKHYAVLLKLDPSSDEIQEQLRRLAELTSNHALFVKALEDAANASTDSARRATLWIAGAEQYRNALRDENSAVLLFQKTLNETGADRAHQVRAAHALAEMYGARNEFELRLDMLEKLAGLEADDAQRRSTLEAAARLAEQLGQSDRALRAWDQHLDLGDIGVAALDAMVLLLEREQRWDRLEQVLRRRVAAPTLDWQRRADLVRIAKLQVDHLHSTEGAIETWRDIAKRFGEDVEVVEALNDLYVSAGQWEELADLLSRAATQGGSRLAAMMCRLGTAYRDQLKDPKRAANAFEQALQVDPNYADAREGLSSLLAEKQVRAEVTRALVNTFERAEDWNALINIMEHRIACASSAGEATRILTQTAELWERQSANASAALECVCRGLVLDPTNGNLESDVLRLAEATGGWEAAANTLRDASAHAKPARAAEFRVHEGGIREEKLNDARGALDAFIAALRLAPNRLELAEHVARIAFVTEQWDEAEAALSFSATASLSQDRHLQLLAQVQRKRPNRALYETLMQFAKQHPLNLEVPREAASMALGVLKDAALAFSALNFLHESAGILVRRGAQAEGQAEPQDCLVWSTRELLQLLSAQEEHAKMVALLVDTARLPIQTEIGREFRRQAADIAASQLRDHSRAMELYRGLLDETPEDRGLTEILYNLYERENRLTELLSLQQEQLRRSQDPDERLRLRLEVAQLIGEMEVRGGRLHALRVNLTERPGHSSTIQALEEVLGSQGRFAELADILAEQAAALETTDDGVRSAALWSKVAELAEGQLADVERALQSYRRVVEFTPSPDALDALARIHATRGEYAPAAQWLERRLVHSSGADRSGVSLRLARAYLGAGRGDRSLVVLERAVQEDPKNNDLRTMLAERYRLGERWDALARLLGNATLHSNDPDVVRDLVYEAVELWDKRVGSMDQAVSVLERGLQVSPDDRVMKAQLAEALRVAGRLDESRSVLEALIEDFGRRRSADRAAAHFQLARVLHEKGEVEQALEQLEVATKMEMSNPLMLRMLGEVAQELKQYDRAERAYRALLLIVRRQVEEVVDVGASEVLFELYRLSVARGDTAQGEELLESALETAAQSDEELRRFGDAMLRRKEAPPLLRALEKRFSQIDDGRGQAEILSRKADVFEQTLNQPEEALQVRLDALERAPGLTSIHDACRSLALRLKQSQKYVDSLNHLLGRLRREDDAVLVGELWLRLGVVMEEDLNDLAGAEQYYRRAEATGHNLAQAWLSLARIAARRGESGDRARMLEKLVDAYEIPSEVRADAFYELADIAIVDPARRDTGVKYLRGALELRPDHARAASLLERASEADPNHEGVMTLYEEVVRAWGDNAMLLGFLERRAARSGATLRDVREAAELAMMQSEDRRAELLMRRAVDLARASTDGLGKVRWAVLGLADRREAAGDIAGAMSWLREAMGWVQGEEALALELRVAKLAARPDGDYQLAANAYERLLEKSPGKEEYWRPLFDIYRELRDEDRLNWLVSQLLDRLSDAKLLSDVRLQWAKYLLDLEERQFDAADILNQILRDEPGHPEAAALLATLYEKSGYSEELVGLLNQQLDVARDQRDLDTIASLSLRLGGVVEKVRRDDAIDVYRRALDWVPQDRRIINALLGLLRGEQYVQDRAEVKEKLLALEKGETAAALALELFSEWEELGQPEGMQRALEVGFRSAPDSELLRQKLESWYESQERWGELAAMLAAEGARSRDVDKLRRASVMYRDRLGDRNNEAEVLSVARQLVPDDAAFVRELVDALVASERYAQAIDEVSRFLDAGARSKSVQAELLRLRAALRLQRGEERDAIRDLESAHALQGAEVVGDLIAALQQCRRRAHQDRDAAAERDVTWRLIELLVKEGDEDQARNVLGEWVARTPNDKEALWKLHDMEVQAERWESVARVCARLVEIESGDVQVEVALRMADACARVGQAADAQGALERVFAVRPQDARIVEQLQTLYELSASHQKLGELLLRSAESAQNETQQYELYKKAGVLFAGPAAQPEAALAALEHAQRLRPDDHEVSVALADAYILTERFADAGRLLETAIRNHPKRRSPELAVLQHRMARLAHAAGDRQLEMQWLQAALDSDKNNGEVAAELAHLAMETRDHETALGALRAITLMKSDGPMSRAMAFLWQARIAHQQGEVKRALLWARKARSEDADLEEAVVFLRELGDPSP